MTKAEIVNKISSNLGLEKNEVLATVENFMDEVKNSLSEGENVYLRGFGSFIVKKRAEKTGRNILGKVFRTVGTPLAGVGFAATNVANKMGEGQSFADAVVDPVTGLELSFPGF